MEQDVSAHQLEKDWCDSPKEAPKQFIHCLLPHSLLISILLGSI